MPQPKRSRNRVSNSSTECVSLGSEMIDPDDFENISRGERAKRAAKARRDKESELMDELVEVLPFDEDTLEKVDKGNLIQLAITYIQMKEIVREDMASSRKNRLVGTDAAPRAITNGTKSSPPAVLEPAEGYSESGESHLLLEVLHSFVIFIHTAGRILFVSDNVEDHLGISQVNIIGRPATDFIHPEDAKELSKQMKIKKRKSTTDPPGEEKTQSRLFYLRMKFYLQRKGARTRQSGYRLVQFSGGLQLQNTGGSGGCAGRGLLCLCRPMQIPSVLEIRMDGNMFMSRHDLRMTFTFCDPRIITLIGYEPKELIGKTAYYFHNPVDATKISNCHSNLMAKGSSVSKYYRFMGKQGTWVWLQTRASIIYSTKNKPQYIVCMNYVIGEEEGQRYLMMEQEQLGYQDPNIQGCLDVAPCTPTSQRGEDAGYVSACSSAAASPESDATRGGNGGPSNLDHLDACGVTSRHHSSTQTVYGLQSSQHGGINNSSNNNNSVQCHIKTSGARLAEAATQGLGHMTSEDLRAAETPMDISDCDSIFACSMSAHITFGDSNIAKRADGNQSSLMLPRAGNNFCMEALNSEELDSLRPEDAHSPMDAVPHGEEDLFPMGFMAKDAYQGVHLSSGDELSQSSADLQNDVDGMMLSRTGLMTTGASVQTTTMNNPMMSTTSLGNNVASCGSQASGMNSEIFAGSGFTDSDMDPFLLDTEQLGSDLDVSIKNDDSLFMLLEQINGPSSPSLKMSSMEESTCSVTGSLSMAPAASLTTTASSGSANFTAMPLNSVGHQNTSSQYGGLESLVNFCHNTPPEKLAVSPSSVCDTSASQGTMFASRPLSTSTGKFAAPTFTASNSQEQQQQQQGNMSTGMQSNQGSLLGQMLISNSSTSHTETASTSVQSSTPSTSASFLGGDQNSLLRSHLPRPRSSSQQSLLRTLLDKEELTEEDLALIPMGSRSGNTSPSSNPGNPFETDVSALRLLRRKSSASESNPWPQPKTPQSGQDTTPRLGSLLSLQMGVPSPSECSLYSPGTPSNSSLPADIMEFAMEFCEKYDSDQSTPIMTDIDEHMFLGQDHNYLQPQQTFTRPKTQNGKIPSKTASPSMVSSAVGTSGNSREVSASASTPSDVQRGCYHDHAYFAAQEPRRSSSSSTPLRGSNGKVSLVSQNHSQAASPRSGSSSTSSHQGSNGKVTGKLPGGNSSSKLQAMLTLSQSLGPAASGSSAGSPCGASSQQPSPSSSLPPPSPLSDNGSCSSGSSAMSELEKHLRGFVPQSPTSCKKNLSLARNSSSPFLQKLLTGELSQELYREIDHQLIAEERQKRTSLHKSLPDMRV